MIALSTYADDDPPEALIGERLFLETRFAQAFFIQCNGDVNAPVTGDPVLDSTVTTGSPLTGPFIGKTMNCRACHLVDEQLTSAGGGMRTYCDFARRSPIPDRGDGHFMTPRNSPPLVNAALQRKGFFSPFRRTVLERSGSGCGDVHGPQLRLAAFRKRSSAAPHRQRHSRR